MNEDAPSKSGPHHPAWSIAGLLVALAAYWVIKKYLLVSGILTANKEGVWALETMGVLIVFGSIVIHEIQLLQQHKKHAEPADIALIVLSTVGGSLFLYVGIARLLP